MQREFFFLTKPVELTELLQAKADYQAGKPSILMFYFVGTAEPKLGHWGGKNLIPVEAIEAVELEENVEEAINNLLRLYPLAYCYAVLKGDKGYKKNSYSIIDDVCLESFMKFQLTPSYTPYEIQCFENWWAYSEEDFEGTTKTQAQAVFLAAQRMLRNKQIFKAQEMLTRPQTHPTKAILEAIQYAGLSIPENSTYEAMVEDSRRQFAEAFPNRV
jgi:hypothetical protein